MALRIGKLCGGSAELWLRMQQAHDLWQARIDLADVIGAIPTLHEA
jgi:plasmid maintenance system antidote protein VapI